MELRSGTSLWSLKKEKFKSYAPLKENTSCDILIVGGGIIGALLAYKLSKEKLSVVLIEKDEIGKGSTMASTALLMYGLDVNLTDLMDMIGEEKAVRAYKLSLDSVVEIKKIIKKLDMGDSYREKKTLYFASNHTDVRNLKKEYEALKKNGFKVDFLGQEKLKEKFSLEKEAAIVRFESAEVDPYKLTHELLRHASLQGVRIYEHTEINVEDKNNIRNCEKDIMTTEGYAIKTCELVFATGYESQNYIKKDLIDLKSSYVTASQPISTLSSHWLKDYLVWETARPYLYIRSTADNRIIIGGEDEKIIDEDKRDNLIPEKSKKLKEKFERLIKNQSLDPLIIDFAWAGTFGETKDGMGYVGIPKDYKNVYFILGFGGNGITFGVIAAEILRDTLLGKEAKNQDLFSFDRLDEIHD